MTSGRNASRQARVCLGAFLVLTALPLPARADFILQFSELETNDNGSLFVDTINSPGSPVGDANISDPNKTPNGIVLSAPGNEPTSLPGFIPRLCGNENGIINGVMVSTTCRVEIQLPPNLIPAADDLKTGIAYLIEPPGRGEYPF